MTQTTVYVDGNTLSPQEVAMVADQRAKVAVSDDAWPRIHAARSVVDRIVSTGETVYGINTGFGALVHERISSEDIAQLQLNLIRSHATALGDPMDVESVARNDAYSIEFSLQRTFRHSSRLHQSTR